MCRSLIEKSTVVCTTSSIPALGSFPAQIAFVSPHRQLNLSAVRSDVIPSHLPNYLRLSKLPPVSPFSQLPFQGCHNPWPFNLTLPNSHSCLLLHFIPQQELFHFLFF